MWGSPGSYPLPMGDHLWPCSQGGGCPDQQMGPHRHTLDARDGTGVSNSLCSGRQRPAAQPDPRAALDFSGLCLTATPGADCVRGGADPVPRTPWVALSPQVDETTQPLLAPSLPERLPCPDWAASDSSPLEHPGIRGSHLYPWGLLAALWRSELRPGCDCQRQPLPPSCFSQQERAKCVR